ncbi:MucBP domain-containing protein [Paenibacillus puldeungensis]|uniref:MucBP domain-containing protein n=1 Tax=Paenibacillus puldeungensis TaxID=696536 RepID=A0ABW3RSI9_9BACL
MKRGLKIAISWLCLFSLFLSPMSVFGASSSDPVWPNPGAIQLSKTAKATGNPGEWEITLKAEGKNVRTSSDVVLVIDKSGSMGGKWWEPAYKMDNAKAAAKKFVDNLLLNGSSNRIAVVSFSDSASKVSDFKGSEQKGELKNAIDQINPDGGTNIQAGLKSAREMLNSSSAENKIIVVLSDGEPTYSYKGKKAVGFTWPNSKYRFAITDFDYGNMLGSGGDFGIKSYKINGFTVQDNGIGTISEAKIAKDAGFKIFSVGLDVSDNSDALNVLKDVQSEGYFPANSDDLNKIFREMAGKIAYAAQDARVIDPMGDMFNLKLKGGQISPQDYTVSQGTVTWDASTEKFIWNVGNIAEGEPATFTYKVIIDSSKNPVSNVLYPTNGKTTLEYTNVNNQKTSKDFEVPKVSIGNGSILMKGYKVNANGKPINAEGVEVESPEFAAALYSEYYKDQNGSEALPIGSKDYSVAAKEVTGYQLKVGQNPTTVKLTATNPTPVIWFGYTEAVEQKLTVKYLEQGSSKELQAPVEKKGLPGSKVALEAPQLPGYSVVAPEKLEYTFTSEPNQVHTFWYKASEQEVKVKFVDKKSGKEIAPAETVKGTTGQKITLEAAKVPGYTPENATFDYTVKDEGNNEYTFYYTAQGQSVEVRYLEQGTDKELAKPTTVKGVTGETVELKALEIAGYTPLEEGHSYTLGTENAPYIFYYTASKQTVNVKFVDRKTGNEIAPAQNVPGVTGQTIPLKAEDVPGYTPESKTAEYTFKAAGNEFTFYYTANKQSVRVEYREQETDEVLAEPITVTGVTGETVELKAKDIAGYTPLKSSDSYKLGVENIPYVFYYKANEQTVNVKFVDRSSGKEIAKAETVKGVTGKSVILKAANVPGYTPENATFDYTVKAEGNNEYTFYYTGNKQSLEVQYLEEGTKEKLADPTTVTGVTGETVQLKALDIAGYTPLKPGDSYTFDVENVPYTFYYKASEQTINVKFVDRSSGKEIAKAESVKGITGKSVTLKAADVPGYTPENATFDYTVKAEGNNEYTFYYTGNKQSLEVQYLEEGTDKELAKPTTVTGVTGETVELKALDIAGYTPVKPSDSYTFDVENVPYIFYYKASEQTVNVKFVERSTGKEIAPAESVKGTTGETVTLKAADVPGYTPENKDSVEYTVKAEGNEYTFYYTANEQSLEVQYLELDTNEKLADPTTVTGLTGQEVKLEAKDIAGYTPQKPSDSYTLGVSNAPYIFYYTKNAPDNNRTLTVKYVDKVTGKELMEPTKIVGKVGEETILEAVDHTDTVTGAVYKPHAYKVPYTFTDAPEQEYVFEYTQDEGLDVVVTIHHVDRESNTEIIDSTTKMGKANKTFVVYPEPITVTGAVYIPEQPEYGFELSFEPKQDVTIYYNKGVPADLVNLYVTYVDRDTNTDIAERKVITGKPGTKLTLTAATVKGYTPEVASEDYILGEGREQSYTFYYKKDAPAADRKLTVKYLESGTNLQLASPTVVTGKPGETKTLTAVSVSGYTPVKTTDSYTFKEQESPEYIFYYTRNSSNPGNPGGSGGSSSPSTPSVAPLPALPPLPAVPPKLETENHYDYINGYPDGSVKPLNNITREEVAAIFYRLLDDSSRTQYLKTGTSLSDVGATRWSNKHISTMENAKVITGYPGGAFKPGQYITRAEFAAIASRFDKLDERKNDKFTDITGHWAEKYIASAANKGWIKGYTDGTFKPNQYITRAEAAAFINSVLNRKVDKDGIHKNAKMWPDNVYGSWYYYDMLEATNHHEYSKQESGIEVWKEVKSNRIYP